MRGSGLCTHERARVSDSVLWRAPVVGCQVTCFLMCQHRHVEAQNRRPDRHPAKTTRERAAARHATARPPRACMRGHGARLLVLGQFFLRWRPVLYDHTHSLTATSPSQPTLFAFKCWQVQTYRILPTHTYTVGTSAAQSRPAPPNVYC